MHRNRHLIIVCLGLILLGLAGVIPAQTTDRPMSKTTPQDKKMDKPFDARKALSAYTPVKIEYDASMLSANQKEIIKKLVAAAHYIDEIFWRQVYSRNMELKEKLSRDTSPEGQALYKYFLINYGPFDRLHHDRPFIGTTPKPLGANFYPEDLTREEFENWIKQHPADEAAFRSNFTVIRRQGDKLVAIPYSQEYRRFLEPAAKLLREAAALCKNASLKKYLELRARDFLTNDYYESDMAWMDLTGTPIEVVIGPYEVYEDRLMGYKASFEAFVTIRNPEESHKLAEYVKHLQDMERNLPIPDEYKNFNRGTSSPISVVDEIMTAGDTHAGVQTSAFNLPNDERVREAKGSKKVMLKNVMRAKFDKSLTPIAKRVLDTSIRPLLDFQSYFDHVVLHEVSHGLGPGKITKNGRATTVNEELRDLYPAIEECKADITGVWNILYLMDKGILPRKEKELFTTYLAGIFRSVRFGVGEAHGLGMMLQYNYLKNKGAILYSPRTGTYSVDFEKMKPAVRDMTHDILMLEAHADYDKTKAFIARYGQVPDEIRTTLGHLSDIPVDIDPIYIPIH